MNKLDKDYLALCQDILDNGTKKQTRNGDTLSVFGRQIRHSMKDGFPLITTKKMYWKGIVTELLWFLRGETNIKFLVDNDCHIWDGDAFRNYCTTKEKWVNNEDGTMSLERSSTAGHYGLVSKEEFINKIKTDDEFAKKWGSLGSIYGKQWRSWETINVRCRSFDEIYNMSDDSVVVEKNTIDQIQNLIHDLKTNPDSRRLMVNSWNVGELDQMVLPPCHYSFQVYTRELSYFERYELADKEGYEEYGKRFGGWYLLDENKESNTDKWDKQNIPTRAISLMWNQRSVDTPLGLPFNIASYGLLLEIIAKMVNMVPDELIGNLGDCHIYTNQIEGVKEQLTREPYTLPTLKHLKTDDFYKSLSESLSLFTHLEPIDFALENYQSHPAIKIPLSN